MDDDGLYRTKQFDPESFDYILLDPPCSALGLRPKLSIVQQTVKDLQYFVKTQEKLIDQAVLLLKPGGYFTYSTCTIHSMENEGMVHYVLKHYSNLIEIIPIESTTILGLPGLPLFGLTEYQRHCVRRFDPADATTDTIGFFVAKFRRYDIK
jgi:methyltransferase NSUN6